MKGFTLEEIDEIKSFLVSIRLTYGVELLVIETKGYEFKSTYKVTYGFQDNTFLRLALRYKNSWSFLSASVTDERAYKSNCEVAESIRVYLLLNQNLTESMCAEIERDNQLTSIEDSSNILKKYNIVQFIEKYCND